ncbi:hypothetical protein PSTG_12020 [Puccinia striiformis f. sp. tritici PST-78]|uniref:Uncharacterized protein n=1 Tax=Puccinia striiformis f. sp. tritici PST-78 TaxID=1165861 RepID=A0A0L0V5W7_9BASI|nr:hypothetical protein PSTG_12020 [Puccinia striiformis f. sp. tritici PST-78]
MSGLPYSMSDMEGGFETMTPSRPGPYTSSSQHQLPHFNPPPPPKATQADLFGKHRDTSDQDQMDDDTPKHQNTPTRDNPFDNLGNQTPQRPTQGQPRQPPRGYGLHNIGSPEDFSERKPKIIKDPQLFYNGEYFMKFLSRFERTALAFQATDYDKASQIIWFIRPEELKVQLESMDGVVRYACDYDKRALLRYIDVIDVCVTYYTRRSECCVQMGEHVSTGDGTEDRQHGRT